ncbi:MAG: peptidoglycan-binding protein [Thermodesulfobacteriota bacterium]
MPTKRAIREHTFHSDLILDLASKHLGEQYVLGARAPMTDSNWKGPWDCAEFVSWCIYQTSGILYGTEPQNDPVRADAFTGFWTQQARRDNAIISIEDAAKIPAACLLRAPGSQRTGHIVFSDGKGGTIEAHSSKTGVIRNTVSGRRWDFGVLVPGVNYLMNEKPVEIVQPKIILRVTSPFMKGPLVQKVQEILADKGYHPGDIDGIYGPQTESAVLEFQNDNGLVPDGEVGKTTFESMGIEI